MASEVDAERMKPCADCNTRPARPDRSRCDPCLAKKRARPRTPPTPERRCWLEMRQRCRNPRHPFWARYGGRGITICERWDSLANFLADMGPRPPGTSLDRINNNGNYEPSNCRWATPREQRRNQNDAVLLTWRGETRTRVEWAEHLGIEYRTLAKRMQEGWDLDRALSQPVRKFGGRRRGS